ncbi:MAG TPA: PaaX family transcriptional regulator C-terminal domain-containing protein [Candidatus Baltobacteraceae bacterium]|jgi:phenylacetic acid degradation operon negative regulatory protein|nr:PaaX family transcriptional regulator C-terminal domain-containing protein [Candidatus Baltobacteraceae bacterium]
MVRSANPEVNEQAQQASERRVVTRPNSFIFTLFGDFVYRNPALNDEVWVGALIRLMGEFGLSEQAVRQAVSRMSRQGWLVARKHGNRSYYALTARGRGRVEAISPRIYGPVVEWDGRWRMITYSVAERQREARDRLRKDLTVLGWAPLSASTWLSPNDGLQSARSAAEASGVLENVDFFVGEFAGPHTDRELLERCWNLPSIAEQYREFIARYEARLQRERDSGALHDDEAFVERMWLVHDYRKFTYVDPGLPSTLLPAHWPGTRAAALFREYYALLAPKAERHFAQAQRP